MLTIANLSGSFTSLLKISALVAFMLAFDTKRAVSARHSQNRRRGTPRKTSTIGAGETLSAPYEVQRIGTEHQPFRGQLSRVVVAVGGLIFLAHCVRVLGCLALARVGLVGMSSQ
jgi:hypothetical protein